MAENTIKEFMEIGGSPVPGITLRQVLRGHTEPINRIAWSPDGRYLASPAKDGTIRIWDINIAECLRVVEMGSIFSLSWSPDGKKLAIPGNENIQILDIDSWNISSDAEGRSSEVFISWEPNGTRLASAAFGKEINLWSSKPLRKITSLQGHKNQINSLAWSLDGKRIASGSESGENAIRIWDVETGSNTVTLNGHTNTINSVVWLSNSKILISSAYDKSIRLWDTNSGQLLQVLEGHVDGVNCISQSHDQALLASKGDSNVLIWRTDSWETVAEISEDIGSNILFSSLAFHPRSNYLATLGEEGTAIRIWGINTSTLVSNIPVIESVKYTTAKLVLVGDSGVGKTGLGWRLAHNEFKEHSSTHGQQFWVVPELKRTQADGTECEAVLWDLAGQPDYRLVHSLYLDDVDTALVLFDPTNRQEPLSGADFWLNQLKDKDQKLRNSILVGARTDRGTSTLTNAELRAYCERNGITGGYIPTSALNGDGLPELIERLKVEIPWDQMTTTVTTVTFKKIKEFVLGLKEKTDRKNILVKPAELRQQLQETDWEFTDAEMMTAVGHLENHGFVKVIHSSNGEQSILLSPDILANLASSIVLEARRNPRGLGVLEEERLLRGEYLFPELTNISKEEGIILLDAATVLFLQRNLCFRETLGNQTFLVFPSLINEKRPLDESIKIEESASYRVKGAVENVYASLVVLLGYTNTFTRTHQWQNQAQYVMEEDEICGFIQSVYRNGEIELVLYYGQQTPEPVRLTFRGLFERFLSRRELDISRYQPVTCHRCGTPLARNVVMDQLAKKKDFSFCHECGEKLQLPNPEPVSRLSRREEVIMDVQQTIAQHRTAFEAALVRVKGLLRDQGNEELPTCFISYSWGTQEHNRWVTQFAKDLRNAGVDVLLDRWYVVPGANLDRYIEQIMDTRFVVVVGTPGLLQKYKSTTSDPVVKAELEMLNLRLRQTNKYGSTILPVLVEGESDTAFPIQAQKLIYVDFRQSAFYFRDLFDMIWRLHNLPFDHPLLDELRASMMPQEMR